MAEMVESSAWIPAEEVEQPYRELLCHDRDMTSTLAKFHGGEIELVVLREERDESYLREVRLLVAGKEVEYGLIEIILGNFPKELQEKILSGEEPLGGLLNESGLAYFSRPKGFFKMPDSGNRFGRYNELLNENDQTLARILEILPR